MLEVTKGATLKKTKTPAKPYRAGVLLAVKKGTKLKPVPGV